MVLGILLIVSGCAYMLSPITLPAQMLVYGFFILMFSRDLTSIFENLIDAGCKNILPFKRFAEKKVNETFDSLAPTDVGCRKRPKRQKNQRYPQTLTTYPARREYS